MNLNVNVRSSISSEAIPSPKSVRRWASVPQSIGDCTPAGGGTWAATVRKSSPMNPSGVQLASAIVPPGLQTRSSSAAACAWSGANIEPNTEVTASKEPSGNGSDSASPSSNSTERPSASAAASAALEERRDVVDADRGAAVPRCGDRGVAAAGGDVEHAPAGLEVGGVAEVLGHEHDPGGHDGEVAARPGRLLPLLDRVEVRSGGVGAGHLQASVWLIDPVSIAGLDRPYGCRCHAVIGDGYPSSSAQLPIRRGRGPAHVIDSPMSYALKLAGIGLVFVIVGVIGIAVFGALWARIGIGAAIVIVVGGLLFFAWRQDQKAREARAGLERI